MRRAAAIGLLLTTAACGGEDGPPDVDWAQIPPAQRATIDRAVEAGDCEGMQAAFDESEKADVLSYLDWHMEDARCY